MKLCKKCDNVIPTSIVIEGKRRSLEKRTYCLECSPFGAHNTKSLVVDEARGTRECTCQKCNTVYVYKPGSGTGPTICWSCRTKDRRLTMKTKSIDYKGSKCCSCGYNKCTDALEFHHTDPDLKEFTISSKYCMSWESIKKELDKCVLLCANCHRELHAQINMGP